MLFPLYVNCCNSSVSPLFIFIFFYFIVFFLRGDVNCLCSQVQCGSFRKSSWKKFFPPILIFHMLILKLHTVFFFFLTPTVLVRSALKKPLPRMLSAADRKPRAHVLIERKWHRCTLKVVHNGITNSLRCFIAFIRPVLRFPPKTRVSVDERESPGCT